MKIKKQKQNNRTTITVHEDVYYRLLDVGKFGESFNDLLNRILDSYEEKNKKK
jgi:predicted CopG family antitoxin